MANPKETLETFSAQLVQLQAISRKIMIAHAGTEFAGQLYELVGESEAMIELFSKLDAAYLESDEDEDETPQYVYHTDTGEVIAQV